MKSFSILDFICTGKSVLTFSKEQVEKLMGHTATIASTVREGNSITAKLTGTRNKYRSLIFTDEVNNIEILVSVSDIVGKLPSVDIYFYEDRISNMNLFEIPTDVTFDEHKINEYTRTYGECCIYMIIDDMFKRPYKVKTLQNGKLELSTNRSRLMLDIPGEKIVIATVNVLKELVGNIAICFPEAY